LKRATSRDTNSGKQILHEAQEEATISNLSEVDGGEGPGYPEATTRETELFLSEELCDDAPRIDFPRMSLFLA